jgi:hypothetical protein
VTDIQATLQLIKEEPSIETLLGRFKQPDGTDTIYPMVLIGTFPEVQTNLPAISLRGLPKDVQYGISDSRITASCYAATEDEAQAVANAVNEFFRDSQGGVSGFAAKFDSSITGNVNDADQSGVIVELRLQYR